MRGPRLLRAERGFAWLRRQLFCSREEGPILAGHQENFSCLWRLWCLRPFAAHCIRPLQIGAMHGDFRKKALGRLGRGLPNVSLNLIARAGSLDGDFGHRLGVPPGWKFAQPEVAKFTGLLVRPRATAEHRRRCREPAKVSLKELHAFAASADSGPYVLVAHSFGGFTAAYQEYPQMLRAGAGGHSHEDQKADAGSLNVHENQSAQLELKGRLRDFDSNCAAHLRRGRA
jgi:hypothetical protein